MATQSDRSFEVIGPLDTDVLLFQRMTATERLGRLFEFDVDLLSEDEQVDPAALLGQSMSIRVDLPEGGERYFNGLVARFVQLGRHGNFAAYNVTLRPWLWFLTRTADCKIFQEKKVPDIIKEVFDDNGFTDVEDLLGGDYRTWGYCVQYRESDFNFVSRLMEQEGIYYFFKHEEGKHHLVLCDSYSSHEPVPDYEQIPFFPPDQHDRRERDHIHDFRLSQQVQPGGYVLNDYDFEKPKANIEVTLNQPKSHDKADGEVYDYPGEYVESSDGDAYARARLEELLAQHEHVEGTGNARGIACGGLFELTGFSRSDQNREYLVVSTVQEMQTDEYQSGESETYFTCSFTAIDSQTPYRSPRTTPKPIVQGPQTAVVVGKSGEEIWTDEYGRVKVQFHWDRYGESDENSSCWVRVAQVWAGKNWGAMHIPRIGQEVIVEFLEGDPDRPIITGRVYNADQKVPYDLPANQTQSGVKSRSSKGGGGGNYNEIRFEDKIGEEQLLVHAEMNYDLEVENDETHWVGNNREKTIDVDETTLIKGNQDETVEGNRTVHVMGAFDETIDSGETRTVSAGVTESIIGGETRDITGDQEETITGGVTQTILGALEQTVISGIKITTPAAFELTAVGGVKITAPAGVQVIAPGGQKQVDSFWQHEGASYKWTFAEKIGIAGLKNEIVGVANSFQGVAIGNCGLKMENVGVAMTNDPLTVDQVATKLKQGAIGAYMYGLSLLM